MAHIRLAQEGDLKHLMAMQFALFESWDCIDPIDKIDRSWFLTKEHENHLRSVMMSKNERLFVVDVNGNGIQGYLRCKLEQREPFLERVGYVSEIYVMPKNRGNGYGSELLTIALKWFKDSGMRWVLVSTHILDTQANNFWVAKGFQLFNSYYKLQL